MPATLAWVAAKSALSPSFAAAISRQSIEVADYLLIARVRIELMPGDGSNPSYQLVPAGGAWPDVWILVEQILQVRIDLAGRVVAGGRINIPGLGRAPARLRILGVLRCTGIHPNRSRRCQTAGRGCCGLSLRPSLPSDTADLDQIAELILAETGRNGHRDLSGRLHRRRHASWSFDIFLYHRAGSTLR